MFILLEIVCTGHELQNYFYLHSPMVLVAFWFFFFNAAVSSFLIELPNSLCSQVILLKERELQPESLV